MKLKAVVFDWAGTIIDHGSRAPMGAFVKVLSEFQVPISVEEARRPMGLPKWDHIKALLTHPDVSARWRAAHGQLPTDRDVDRVFEVFVPLNAAVVADFADVIPGVLETIAQLRRRGIKVGSTTGYTRAIMERLLPVAAEKGLVLDNLVCAGDLASGRPAPSMMYKCFLDLDVWPASSVVKVDDTEAGIAEGLAAGCWTVGVTLSGNAVGLSLQELERLSEAELVARRDRATRQLARSGAHFVIDSAAHLESAIDQIEGRLAREERP
jgi:phosphonoacetaldehyde hydrolase